jgi:hypothetical protein
LLREYSFWKNLALSQNYSYLSTLIVAFLRIIILSKTSTQPHRRRPAAECLPRGIHSGLGMKKGPADFADPFDDAR